VEKDKLNKTKEVEVKGGIKGDTHVGVEQGKAGDRPRRRGGLENET